MKKIELTDKQIKFLNAWLSYEILNAEVRIERFSNNKVLTKSMENGLKMMSSILEAITKEEK